MLASRSARLNARAACSALFLLLATACPRVCFTEACEVCNVATEADLDLDYLNQCETVGVTDTQLTDISLLRALDGPITLYVSGNERLLSLAGVDCPNVWHVYVGPNGDRDTIELGQVGAAGATVQLVGTGARSVALRVETDARVVLAGENRLMDLVIDAPRGIDLLSVEGVGPRMTFAATGPIRRIALGGDGFSRGAPWLYWFGVPTESFGAASASLPDDDALRAHWDWMTLNGFEGDAVYCPVPCGEGCDPSTCARFPQDALVDGGT